jgi:hypothetical protein
MDINDLREKMEEMCERFGCEKCSLNKECGGMFLKPVNDLQIAMFFANPDVIKKLADLVIETAMEGYREFGKKLISMNENPTTSVRISEEDLPGAILAARVIIDLIDKKVPFEGYAFGKMLSAATALRVAGIHRLLFSWLTYFANAHMGKPEGDALFKAVEALLDIAPEFTHEVITRSIIFHKSLRHNINLNIGNSIEIYPFPMEKSE